MKRLVHAILSLLAALAAAPAPAGAQTLSEVDRLRMEVISLRQLNDSLQRELQAYTRNYVPDLWASLTGLDPDEDAGMDYSGFGLRGTRKETLLQREVAAAVPCFRLPYNDIYEQFIEKYTVSRRKSMSYILGRYNMHLPLFRATFSKYGVPEDLIPLCIVESAVSREALSPVGALGMWQIMPATARQYGLTVDECLDERLVIDRATDAAARILRDLRRNLGSWELAVLAYNCGAANVRKAIIRSNGSKDVWTIYDWLPAETRAYLPSLVAAAYCVKYHDALEITPRRYAEPRLETYTVRKPCLMEDLAAAMAMRLDELRRLNCQYVQGLVPEAGMTVTVPPGMGRILEVSGF